MPAAEPERVAEVSDRTIARTAAQSPCGSTGRLAADALPILVYAHGGGFVFCDLDSHDGLCRNIANLLPAVVVSVDYRLAPENRWPAAAEDVYAAHQMGGRPMPNRWAVTPSRIAVGGDSAGGNLAAVTAMMARDRGGPPLAAQYCSIR